VQTLLSCVSLGLIVNQLKSSHLLKALYQAAVRVRVSYPSYLLKAVVGKAHATLLWINRVKLQYYTATPV